MHMTGRYPEWWQGRRFDRPVAGWICGRSGERRARTPLQRVLTPAAPARSASGAIPKDSIEGLVAARGVSGLYDTHPCGACQRRRVGRDHQELQGRA